MSRIVALVNSAARSSAAFALFVLPLADCKGRAVPPAPTFADVFTPVPCEFLGNSSPNMIDLDRDDVPDIVFGNGVDRMQPRGGRFVFVPEPEVPGYVMAVSGATNAVLWTAPHTGEAFTTPRFAQLNGDGVPDVVMGGREGALAAFSGVDGAVLWRASASDVAVTSYPFNFHTVAVVDDQDGDGVQDLVMMYGGDDTKDPREERSPGYIVLISGATGARLAAHQTPDGRESYSAVIVYSRSDGAKWLIFGTGGETFGGAIYRAPLASLRDGSFPTRAERLIEPGSKGVTAPATLVDITADGELDIVVSTFDGRLIVLDGANGSTIWSRHEPNEETYHPAAVMRISADGRLGLVVSRAIGVFPKYGGSVHRIHDARNGSLLYQYRGPAGPSGAPLAVDLTGDGVDEPIFFGSRGRIHIHHGATGELIVHDIPAYFSATPLIADPRRTGSLELIGVAWENAAEGEGVAHWRNLSCQLLRMNLNAATPERLSWAGYMGTAHDGQFPPASPQTAVR